ncbi:lactate racemase domain-containing protein [Bacteroidota bacterium]
MLYITKGTKNTIISSDELRKLVFQSLDRLGERSRVLVIPPDITRIHSRAGEITKYIYDYFSEKLCDILPALGTHNPMTNKEIEKMFPGIPIELFRIHNWRKDIKTIGYVPAEYVKKISANAGNFDWPVQLNKMIINGGYDLIISVGQVVPHEVIGMANYNKNIFVGTGGPESINLSHYLGACYGMEKIMGQTENPVRAVMNYASDKYISNLPVLYIQTVLGNDVDGNHQLRGLYIGDDIECFISASELSEEINIKKLDKTLKKVVVYLNPSEYKSTWLGNKSIYRTRMAMADNAELLILAPGIKTFGEDAEIDRLIRKYGYSGTSAIKEAVKNNIDLRGNLSAAAHLIHGSSEDRFNIKYCTGELNKTEIESVGFEYGVLDKMMKIYNPEKLKDGYNIMPDGEQIYYISNPALGLWMLKVKS